MRRAPTVWRITGWSPSFSWRFLSPLRMAFVMSTSSALACRSGSEFAPTRFKYRSTDNRNDKVSLFRRILELVDVRESPNDSLHPKFALKAARLLGRAHVERKVELVDDTGRGEEAAEEGAADVSYCDMSTKWRSAMVEQTYQWRRGREQGSWC